MANQVAGANQMFVCAVCGKRSLDLYGMTPWRDSHWDESCMLHAVLCLTGEPPYTAVRPRKGR